MRRSVSFAPTVLVVAVALLTQVARGADPPPGGKIRLDNLLGPPKGTSLLGIDSESRAAEDQQPTVRVGLVPTNAKTGEVVTLSVTVTVPPDYYTYSTSPNGLGATRIEITSAAGLSPLGEFEADHEPKIITDETTGKPVEKFEQGVTWLRQYKMTAERPEDVRVSGLVDLRYCNSKGCRIFSQKISTRLVKNAAGDEPAAAPPSLSQVEIPKSLGGQSGHVKLTFLLGPSEPKPGETVTLGITMALDPDWHTYSTTQKPGIGSTTTRIELKSTKNLVPMGETFKPSRDPEVSGKEAAGLEPKEVYHGEITWTRHFKYQPTGNDKGFGVSGSIYYGVCDQAMCLPPKTVRFSLGDLKGAGQPPKPIADDSDPTSDGTLVAESGTLGFYLLGAFFGGMLLNIMPCVLPVLAIKVLSFVQQAGESRSRIFLLNVAYSAGVIVVFLALATLAAGTQLGLSKSGNFAWGSLFQSARFNLVMACLVFAMGLSLLGVFEIPVPGFVGSAAGGAQREGFLGAALTGVFATLLATPCTGPFMATAVGWAVSQPALTIYLLFGVMGLGMAFPYLVLGLFPRLVRWLPKPGDWMTRFKEFAGFVLLASVIFIVYYTDKRYTIPLLVMLLGVALGLWMIGNLYDVNSRIHHKWTVRLVAVALTILICWSGFSLSGENKYRLPWQPFSESRIAALLKENKPVLVDFTADWCINCHFNEGLALNTKDTKELVEKNNIVPLLADFTDESEEIHRWLQKFRQNGVPLTVIFPPGKAKPIVLTGVYTQGELLEALRHAVEPIPSASVETTESVVR
ncbi:MAG TPA: thioredoxin family protein [Planctomycetaceae bacterium]|nr:thioredoxin family protein [Planctomycetaceae bacterium]